MNVLTVLDGSGDVQIEWEPGDAEACAKARQTVQDLKSRGYSFFLVSGLPADEVTAGQGKLIVRKLAADEIVEPTAPAPDNTMKQSEAKPTRGRPRKEVVAVRPLRGG